MKNPIIGNLPPKLSEVNINASTKNAGYLKIKNENVAIMINGKLNFALMYGNLNFPLVASVAVFSSTLCDGSNRTPPQTRTNANNVPMLVKSKMKFI